MKKKQFLEKRQAREKALKILFEQEFNNSGAIKNTDKEIQKTAQTIVDGVKHYRENIDSLIKEHSHSWELSRMPAVDLNILRIAVYEMQYADPKVPPKVCINEALEMAKIYGTANSPAFINGLLDPIFKHI